MNQADQDSDESQVDLFANTQVKTDEKKDHWIGIYPWLILFLWGGQTHPFLLKRSEDMDPDDIDVTWLSGILSPKSRLKHRNLKQYPDYSVSIFGKIQKSNFYCYILHFSKTHSFLFICVTENSAERSARYVWNLNIRYQFLLTNKANPDFQTENVFDALINDKPYRILLTSSILFKVRTNNNLMLRHVIMKSSFLVQESKESQDSQPPGASTTTKVTSESSSNASSTVMPGASDSTTETAVTSAGTSESTTVIAGTSAAASDSSTVTSGTSDSSVAGSSSMPPPKKSDSTSSNDNSPIDDNEFDVVEIVDTFGTFPEHVDFIKMICAAKKVADSTKDKVPLNWRGYKTSILPNLPPLTISDLKERLMFALRGVFNASGPEKEVNIFFVFFCDIIMFFLSILLLVHRRNATIGQGKDGDDNQTNKNDSIQGML